MKRYILFSKIIAIVLGTCCLASCEDWLKPEPLSFYSPENTYVTKDGLEAVEMIKNAKPDIAIIDVIMPQLDGLGVLEKINESNLDKKPLFIVLSAVGQDKITARALELGAQYYVVKPFDISLLMRRIKELKFYKPSRNKKLRNE